MIFNLIIKKSKKNKEISDLLNECRCIVKTVNLEWNDRLKESISLNSFKYCEIVDENWESSKLREYFNNNIFVFIVFKKEYSDSKLINVKVWKMPLYILDGEVKSIWEKTRLLIKEGKIVNYIDSRKRYVTYFPTSGETKFIHVRPHAQNSKDTYPLPVRDKFTNMTEFTKHSFWLNNNFIRKIILENKYYE